MSDDTSAAGARPLRSLVILSQYYAPESGAPQIRLGAMARELRKAGVAVRVITGMPNYPTGRIYPGFEGRLTMRDEIDGVPVQRVWLYPASGRGALGRLANYLSFTATGGLALLLGPRAELVFVEAQPLTLAAPALLNRLLRGTPYVYNTPDLQVEYASEGRWGGARLLVGAARRLERGLMHRAMAVTTVTHAFMEHFAKEHGVPVEHLAFLPNGADTERLCPSPRSESLAERLGVGERKVFTFAGTHAPYQGLEVILEAAKLLAHRKDLVILMVGDGPMRAPLIEQAAREGITNVLFQSSPFEEMPELMSLTWASLVVLRKLQLATKMRLSKAIPPLACGVPLVYAGWGETADIVAREGVGLVAEPENAEALARAIERLADEPGLRDACGTRGRALALREFSWSFLVGDWLRQMTLIAQGNPPKVPGFSLSAEAASPSPASARERAASALGRAASRVAGALETRAFAAGEVLGRHAVERVPELRERVGRWVRRPAPEPQSLTLDELGGALRDAGVEAGRDLLVHSSWAGLGKLQARPSEVVAMLRALIGPEATLLMPTHAVEKERDGLLVYDVERSPTRMGFLAESLRRAPGALRSPCPIAPVSALGPAAAAYTRDYRAESGGTPWGRGSPYWELGERRGQVLVLGLDFVRALTLMHCAFDVLGDENPIANFYEPIDYWVVRGGREERWSLLRQRRALERQLASLAFRRMALRSGTVRATTFRGVALTVVDARAFLDWHLPIARSSGLPYWGFERRSRASAPQAAHLDPKAERAITASGMRPARLNGVAVA